MTEYNSHGYTDVRNYVQNNHNWLALLDDGGTEHLRWDLSSNSNVTLESDASANPIEYTVTVTGQDLEDAGATLPVTLDSVAFYKESGASTALASDLLRDSNGDATQATLELSSDTVDVSVFQEWPPQ